MTAPQKVQSDAYIQPLVSVIVATHNRNRLLHALLESLAACKPLPDEVVVVDDGSNPVVAIETALPFPLLLLRNEKPIGPGAARNRGCHESQGDILLFTDDDCLVASDWVGNMVSALMQGRAQGLGGVGGSVCAVGNDLYSRYYDFHRVLQPRPHDAKNPTHLPYLVTANCGVWRHAFMRGGGFDSRIPSAGGEDAAFSMRMLRRGYFFESAPNAVVHHHFRAGLCDFVRTFYRYGLGGRYVVDRYLSSRR